jgi:hypothetical protein
MGQPSSIDREVSAADKAALQRLVADPAFTVDDLAAWLKSKGYDISRSAVGRYAKNIRAIGERLRQSREVTEALAKEIGDAAVQGQQGRLLVEMARTLAWDLVMKLQEGGAEVDTKDLAFIGKALAEMAKALRYDQDFELKLRERIERETREKAAAEVETTATEKGLSRETVEAIKARILGVKSPEGA